MKTKIITTITAFMFALTLSSFTTNNSEYTTTIGWYMDSKLGLQDILVECTPYEPANPICTILDSCEEEVEVFCDIELRIRLFKCDP